MSHCYRLPVFVCVRVGVQCRALSGRGSVRSPSLGADDDSRGFSGADPAAAGGGAMHRHGASVSVRSAALFAASRTDRRSGRGVVAVGRPACPGGHRPRYFFAFSSLAEVARASEASRGPRGRGRRQVRRRVPPATGHPWLRATPRMCASARRS